MARLKCDGVIEAVRYTPEGMIALARGFERRGAAFSDHILFSREELLSRLKSGKKFVIGKRLLYLAGSFETSAALKLVEAPDHTTYITTQDAPGRDNLQGAPLF